MVSFEDDPFWNVFEELDQVHFQYSKLEIVAKGASKLLGDCKMGNIVKELKKLKEKNMLSLEAQNASLATEVADLKVELAMRKDKIRKLKVRTESMERIREVVGTPRDVLNKARLFDNDIKTEGEIAAAKIIPILVVFTQKMEAALVDI